MFKFLLLLSLLTKPVLSMDEEPDYNLEAKLKAAVKQEAGRIFKIKIVPVVDFPSGKYEISTGTAFLIDPANGIFVTNAHIVSSLKGGTLTLIDENGKEYEKNQVKFLGSTPSTCFGDYAFLSVEGLALKSSPSSLLPWAKSVQLDDTVATMGYGSGRLTLDLGSITDPYSLAGSRSDKGSPVYRAQLRIKGGSSGSPVFKYKNDSNDSGAQFIGLIYASNETHASIVPAWILIKAYNQLIEGKEISIASLGFPVKEIKIDDLVRYYQHLLEVLENFIGDVKQQKRMLLKVDSSFKPWSSDYELGYNNVFLEVNDSKIGADLSVLQNAMDQGEIKLKVLSADKEKTVSFKPTIYESKCTEMLNVHGYRFFKSEAHLAYEFDLPEGLPVYPLYSEGKISTIYMINDVKGHQVKSFSEFVDHINKTIFSKNLLYFHCGAQKVNGGTTEDLLVNISNHQGKDFYVTSFNPKTGQWENTESRKYVENIEAEKQKVLENKAEIEKKKKEEEKAPEVLGDEN